jgi:hypothetical protein
MSRLDMSGRFFAAAVVAAGVSVSAGAAWAHHSFAMFDVTKVTTIEGTVKDYAWTNPHVWVDLMVPNSSGVMERWGLESQSVGILYRMGWKSDSLKPGDKVTVTPHPMKNGTVGGQVMKIATADGRELTTAMNRR